MIHRGDSPDTLDSLVAFRIDKVCPRHLIKEGLGLQKPGSMDLEGKYLSMDSSGYFRQAEDAFKGLKFDLVGVSAGFDTYLEDWGRMLSNDDYKEIGRIIRE